MDFSVIITEEFIYNCSSKQYRNFRILIIVDKIEVQQV